MDGGYDFSDALRLAKAGQRLRRINWSPEVAGLLFVSGRLVYEVGGVMTPFLPAMEDLLADDWQVVGSLREAAPVEAGRVVRFGDHVPRALGRRKRDREVNALLREIHGIYVELGHPCGNQGCGDIACVLTRKLALLVEIRGPK